MRWTSAAQASMRLDQLAMVSDENALITMNTPPVFD
jgi:hypothetical protein